MLGELHFGQVAKSTNEQKQRKLGQTQLTRRSAWRITKKARHSREFVKRLGGGEGRGRGGCTDR